ncbi:MAG: hypothetical protein JOZ51_18680 [Chloroflexi bacterium]|nr:hypothetical protein [Chloroflexota bacterium]
MFRSRSRRSPVTMCLLWLALGVFAIGVVWQARPAYALTQWSACYSYVPVYADPYDQSTLLGWMAQGDTFAVRWLDIDYSYGNAYSLGVWGWAPTQSLCRP